MDKPDLDRYITGDYGERQFPLEPPEGTKVCPRCFGDGFEHSRIYDLPVTCSECDGTGEID